MSSLIILLAAFIVLISAYFLYGKYLERTWGISSTSRTPAYTLEDGQDYTPTSKFAVFAHQFSSIAGAGPVTGPIIASMFGWLPVFLWIIFGGIFFGAVQDFGALYVSVKNEGKSIGLIVEKYIGKTGKRLFLLFCWLFTLLVIAAFVDIVANTFNGFAVLEGGRTITVLENAAAGSISMLFIIGAIAFGLFIKYMKPTPVVQTVVGIVLIIAMIAAGIEFPLYFSKNIWILIVFGYLFIASVMPMWLLMQPRDFLCSFFLIGMIVGAVLGIFIAKPTMNLNMFNGFTQNGQQLFPVLFITIACGAVSGFHSLVSSGTSSKTIRKEKDMLFVGFGAMMLECLLAVIALIVVGAVAINGVKPEGTPFQIFAGSVAGFLELIGIPHTIAICFMTLCVSALALTSVDTVARVGRMSLQELFTTDRKEKAAVEKFFTNKYCATVLTLIGGYALTAGGYQNIWPLFGAANQLLSALVLISLSVFMKTTGRKGGMLYVPMIIMLAITTTSLVQSILSIIQTMGPGTFLFGVHGLQLFVAVLLLSLAFMVVFSSLKQLLARTELPTFIPPS